MLRSADDGDDDGQFSFNRERSVLNFFLLVGDPSAAFDGWGSMLGKVAVMRGFISSKEKNASI